MLRRIMTAVALAGVACSSDSSPDANDIELTSNATSYTWIPGVPPPPLTVTLHNGSGDFLQVIVCSREGTPTAPIQYQQQQGDGSWADISFGTFVCNFPRILVQIESGATWTLPPEGQAFPPDSGTYRIVLLPSDTSVGFPIVSNSFTVDGDYEGTS